ncbi:MAG: sigma-70 family RNA polymerase sigma factor [Candidatus Micrarchaeota archaeon]
MKHPLFTGTLLTLMHKVFGISHTAESLLSHKEDAYMFLWYVYEDERIAFDGSLTMGEMENGFVGKASTSRRPDRDYELLSLAMNVHRALETLTSREQMVLEGRFGGGATLQELADEFHITPERVRQIESKALRKMRMRERAALMEPFTEDFQEAPFYQGHAYSYTPVLIRRYIPEIVAVSEFALNGPPEGEALLSLSLEISALWRKLHEEMPEINLGFLENCGFIGISEEMGKIRKPGLSDVKGYLLRSIMRRYPGYAIARLVVKHEVGLRDEHSQTDLASWEEY